MVTKILVCGSRRYLDSKYKAKVYTELQKAKEEYGNISLIEGCCFSSADEVAEVFAEENGIEIEHHPGKEGSYLSRNITMVKKCDIALCFWDGYSRGTSFTLSQAVMKGKPVKVFDISMKALEND